MAEQKSRDAGGVRRRTAAAGKRARRGAGEVVDEAGSTAGRTAKGAADAPDKAVDQVKGAGDRVRGESDGGRHEAATMREELGSIVRETAMEVLGPIMRSATRSAAKYAVRKAPEVAMGKVLPKLRDLESNIEDAGGAGAFARGTLSSASEGGGLTKLKQLGRGDGKDRGSSERVPEQSSVDVAAPVESVYDQFAQLDDFAQLLSGGDIVEEQENERIVWTNEDENATAVVTFHRLDERLTRVMVSYDQPQNFAGKALSALHTRRRGLQSDLARFKALVEMNELEREDGGGDAASDADQDAPRGRRRASRREESSQEEPDTDEYDDEEPYDAEEEEEPEAESGEIVDAESEEIPEDEGEEPPEAESEPEPDEEPEPKPRRRPAPKRAPRRRAPARASKSPRARAKRA